MKKLITVKVLDKMIADKFSVEEEKKILTDWMNSFKPNEADKFFEHLMGLKDGYYIGSIIAAAFMQEKMTEKQVKKCKTNLGEFSYFAIQEFVKELCTDGAYRKLQNMCEKFVEDEKKPAGTKKPVKVEKTET